MRSRVIGGEFELHEVPDLHPQPHRYYCYSSGRAALYQILMSIKLETFKVWLPDWLCESMIDAVQKTGIIHGFYTLGQNLRMNVDEFVRQNKPISENDVIVLVNYFGLVNIDETIQQLRNYGVQSLVIEDDVQALFSFLDDTKHKADYRFTSLRKSIPCPDGGLVFTKKKMPEVKTPNTFSNYKLQASLLKGNATEETNDVDYLSLFEEGEERIDENYNGVMSKEAVKIWWSEDLDEVANARKRNADFLVVELSKLGIAPVIPIKKDVTPLFVPIVIENRDELRRELRRNNIFCPVHWPLRDDMKNLKTGSYMAEHELSLVIDQRYTLEDMQCMVDIIKKWICK